MKIQHKRISRTKVSHHHSHQSIKRKRSNSLIHVTVGSSKSTQSITNHHQPTNKNLVFIFIFIHIIFLHNLMSFECSLIHVQKISFHKKLIVEN